MKTRRLLVAIAGVTLANTPWLRAQAPSDRPLAFEVVSIRPFPLPPGKFFFRFKNTDPGGRVLKSEGNHFREKPVNLGDLIMDAYDVEDYQISGLPAWAKPNQDLYDLDAKSEGEGTPTSDQLKQMLRTMLADRFQLRIHRETKELPLYYLVVGKGGLKMKEVGVEAKPAQSGPTPFRAVDAAPAARMIQGNIGGLVSLMAHSLDQPLIDKTGLTAKYEYLWDAQELRENPQAVFQVAQRLGLKLEATKGPLDMLVIDHVEKPSAN